MKARIVDIKKFAVHDGDGIRTTVFFKGCPLKCLWCHNPESISFKPQLAYIKKKCILCGECIGKCGAHSMVGGKHVFDKSKCVGCGECEPDCLGEALKFYGKEYTIEQLMPVLLEDKSFYESSGGGVTLSGGECLCQPEFCGELLKVLKLEGISTAVDTCGFVSRAAIDMVLPYTDIFLYDCKAIDEPVHITCTGHSNKVILENLRYIDDCGKPIEIRIPYVPQYNEDQLDKIGMLLTTLKNLTKIRVLAYHSFAGSKYDSLGMENTMPKVPLSNDEEMKAARDKLRGFGLPVTND